MDTQEFGLGGECVEAAAAAAASLRVRVPGMPGGGGVGPLGTPTP